jgi:caa(3)-type oxidase subunit IV
MANPAQAPAHDHGSHDASHAHDSHHVDYWKVYWVLLVLLAFSIAGPMIGIKLLTLITAFGIAVVKAYLVAANFMHLKFEKKYIAYLLCTAIAFMFLFYAGVSPDVMKHRGRGWQNVAAEQETQRALSVPHDEGHGGH